MTMLSAAQPNQYAGCEHSISNLLNHMPFPVRESTQKGPTRANTPDEKKQEMKTELP